MKIKLLFLFAFFFIISMSNAAQLNGKKFTINVDAMEKIFLEFKDNIYKLSNSEEFELVKGNFKIKGNSIFFNDIEGAISCPPDVAGEYEFTYENKELKLKLINDDCGGRGTMASATWKEVD